MKDQPLAIQIWFVFALITLAISIILAFIFPRTLRGFFTEEIYSTIDSAQDIILNRSTIEDFWNDNNTGGNSNALEDIRSVNHILVYGDNQIVLDSPIPIGFLNQIKESISRQKDFRDYYKGDLEKEKALYVISKGESFGMDTHLVSYMKDTYRQDLVNTLFKRLIFVMTIIFLLSWIPALFISRYLSRPLVNLESKVDNLAKNHWDKPINLGRKDEIGKLGNSVEKLRVQLIRQDEAERNFLQNISHELKTPVMVIRSFSQAIKDGIFPKGDLASSMEVIEDESQRLEKKIKNLLYFSKLEYMSNFQLEKKEFLLDKLIEDVVARLSWNKAHIKWIVKLESLLVFGDMEQWRIVIENLIDNQMRYAKTTISIDLKEDDDGSILTIWNDGPPIEKETLDNLFTVYNKGYKGEFGLGLAIVEKILKIHNSTIIAVNEDVGVSFKIRIKHIGS